MNAIILSIGDELTLGQTVDTNAAWVSAQLAAFGIMTEWHLTVPDDEQAIARALTQAAGEAELVIVTGGLGPTADDLTRQGLARAMGVTLEEDATSLEQIERWFAMRQRPMSALNRVQALRPTGTEPLENPAGTAPGIRARWGGATIYILPGVPYEMTQMFDMHIRPALQRRTGRVILTRKINTFGRGESDIGQSLGELMRRERNPTVGTTVADWIVSVRVRSVAPTHEEAAAALEHTTGEIERILGPLVFSYDQVSLAEVVNRQLIERHKTVATAESCTGGLVCKLLTDIPGSSACCIGGWIVYSNEQKQAQLQVPAEVIAAHGAVSEPVAVALAANAARLSGADFALSLTGIAGPDGGSEAKPVGTVWIGVAWREGEEVTADAKKYLFPGDRQQVRDRAARTALNLLRRRLIGQPEW